MSICEGYQSKLCVPITFYLHYIIFYQLNYIIFFGVHTNYYIIWIEIDCLNKMQ